MKRQLIALLGVILLSACSGSFPEKQQPVCHATAMLGGQPQTVQIYGVRTVANQIEYRAGYPFNWRWVNRNNFTSSTCK